MYILLLETVGTVKDAQKLSMLYGNFSAFYTLDAGDQFGNSAAALGDINVDGVGDLVVGAYHDDDGGTDAGAVHIIFIEINTAVKGAQKISVLFSNFNTFYTLAADDQFGGSVPALGDIDGDSISDLAVGTIRDDDGGTRAGAVYVFFLEINGNLKNAQKISNLYGNFNAFYTLDAYDVFGHSAVVLGDVDGDGVIDLAVGAYLDDDGLSKAGSLYIINLLQCYCESPNPSVLPTTTPTSISPECFSDGSKF